MTIDDEVLFQVPPIAKYDGVVREGSYLMRHLLAAFDVSLGVNVNPKATDEDKARAEHGEIQQAMTHARNVIRALAVRRDVLSDALVIVERPRVAAVEEEQRSVPQADGGATDGE